MEAKAEVGLVLGNCPRCGVEHPADILGAPVNPTDTNEDGGRAEYFRLRCRTCGMPYLEKGPSVIRE